MKHVIDLVVMRSAVGLEVAEGAYSLSELRRHWSPDTPVLVDPSEDELKAAWPANPKARCLLIQTPWLALDLVCLERLHAALDGGFDVALACDSTHPAPMPASAYATGRGMERFVQDQPFALHEVPAHTEGLVALVVATAGPCKPGGEARTVRVEGAWAHDASAYFASSREEVLPLVPSGVRQVLDVGGGRGGFLAALKAARPEVQTHLAELTHEAAGHARANPGVDCVWLGDFQRFETLHRFDCISFLDVLEHMEDPEQALRKAKTLLAPGGVVVASIPNVGHWSVVADLLEGRWDWAAAGIHCYTHLRFFTKHTIVAMLARCGLVLEVCTPVVVPCPPEWLQTWGPSAGLTVDRDSLEAYAFLLRARPLQRGDGQ